MDMAIRLERLESSVKKLAADVGEIRNELRATNRRIDSLDEAVADGFEKLEKDMLDVRRVLAASVDAMTSVIRQAAVDKTVETRLRRLESAVFGSKH
jgi:septal ring factor EnvC (AmiA/AmiB activator)